MIDEKRQSIVDKLEALGVRHLAAYRAAEAELSMERARLQAACAELGHIFKSDHLALNRSRSCVVCGAGYFAISKDVAAST